MSGEEGPQAPVDALVQGLISRELSIATAESLTGGALCARLVDVPGASETVRGGVCTYHSDLKAQVLGVDLQRLAECGPVDSVVAQQMAQGAQRIFGAQFGVSTTGVAGPGPHDGHPAGTVIIACAHPGGVIVRELHLEGGRGSIRRQSVDAAIDLALEVLELDSHREVDEITLTEGETRGVPGLDFPGE